MNQHFTSFQEFRKRYPMRPNDEGMLLGSGSYGKVIKVEDQVETEWVAIKISEFKGNDPKSLKAEFELAQRVPRQANIARYDACYRLETDTGISDFALMKYYPDGNLADLLKHRKLSPDDIFDLTRGILLGLPHLHQHRIVHRDFKPANILISRDKQNRFVPKIADFGLSKLVSDDEIDSSDFDLSDGRGTPSCKAPEQIEGSRVSFNLDLWAFGVILYEMLTGEKPFASDARQGSEQLIKREIEKKIVKVTLPKDLDRLPEPCRTMVKRCLVKDIRKRARKEEELLGLLNRHLVDGLLQKAEKAIGQQDFARAQLWYEEALSHEPGHTGALQGIRRCQEEMRPKPVMIAEDATDLRHDASAFTDVYQPRPAVIPSLTDSPLTDVYGGNSTPRPAAKPRWIWAAPVAAVLLGGIVVWKRTGTTDQPAGAAIAKTVDRTTAALSGPTQSAPVTQPAVKSLKSAETAITKAALLTKTTVGPALPTPVGPTAEEQAAAVARARREQAQQDYEKLISEGESAIKNGNNKSAAMTAFARARQLAEAEGLITGAASELYSTYLTKADLIFQREEYEGAKSWYLVAQTLMNTADVRAKIKECDRNL
ncbi:serine/threonine-protein kinase [Arsenicibacter rosenii]|uniref:Protein kinase domain-containing protein n=1 Tax=Arsenicibacter rosenii TaxID=1750698 RepID=A0A1S2VF18_9BACT|nr:serine/threonine-protein kinase [Arsenicibacter rosenii]OIN57010.1 hypothetical protein BLX24_21910 [Arsenicibacter rosenii]